jgi:hypothetical protein
MYLSLYTERRKTMREEREAAIRAVVPGGMWGLNANEGKRVWFSLFTWFHGYHNFFFSLTLSFCPVLSCPVPSGPAQFALSCMPFLPCSALSCPILPCPALSCPVLSCPVLSCPVLSCPVLSCPVLSCPVLSCPVLSCPVLSCPVLSSPVLSCPALSCPVLSCPVLSCPVLSRPVLSCPVLPCLALSCPVPPCPALSPLSRPVSRSVLPCLALSCPVPPFPTLSCPVLSFLSCQDLQRTIQTVSLKMTNQNICSLFFH